MSPGVSEGFRRIARDAILRSTEFAGALAATAARIVSSAEGANSEASIAFEFDAQLKLLLHDTLDYDYAPVKEEAARRLRNRSSGRIDSRVGNLIVEFKQPSTLRTARSRESATGQLIEYLEGIHDQDGKDVVGFVTDGVEIQKVWLAGGEVSRGDFGELDGRALADYVATLLSLDSAALSAKNLVSQFEDIDGPLFELARTFFAQLTSASFGRTTMLFEEWRQLFNLAHDDTTQQRSLLERREALARLMRDNTAPADRDREYAALFAIQSAYAVVIKLVAFKTLTDLRHLLSLTFKTLSDSGSGALRSHLANLEDGGIFHDQGFTNLLEGDFFSWYVHPEQWTAATHAGVRGILSALAPFENVTRALPVQDLFKDLYMAVIPDKVRHSLGEFYTPPWLADQTITSALDHLGADRSTAWRGLDPCCGSGTFVTSMIQRVVQEDPARPRSELRDAVLSRVTGIDLNPLAVLTARVNYFVNLSPVAGDDEGFEIPIYLGDASKIPARVVIDGVECLKYSIETKVRSLAIVIPRSALRDKARFSTQMNRVEAYTKIRDVGGIIGAIEELCAPADITAAVRAGLAEFATALVALEEGDWNGIWPRIVANFLTTAELGRFDIIVGNPPWIDWKNLPANYRSSLIELSIDRQLFSGDSITGGVNLNICALIANVAAENWLAPSGALVFLMPETLIFQQTYEGFRRLRMSDDKKLYFQKLIDWTRAGHPFKPVQQRFFGFVIADAPQDYAAGIPVDRWVLRGRSADVAGFSSARHFGEIEGHFDLEHGFASTPESAKTYFALSDDRAEVRDYQTIAGASAYRGREGIEFYPQELLLLRHQEGNSRTRDGHVTELFHNYQSTSSKYRIQVADRILETRYLRPLIKGVQIGRFHLKPSEFFVPFVYESDYLNGRAPLPPARLVDEAPRLLKYFQDHRDTFEAQTQYNSRIIGAKHDTEFYAIARVGEYSHADTYVAFRDNTSWQAVVVEKVDLPWGGQATPVFQNHAASIAEGPHGWITSEEAHFVCGFMNAPIVGKFMTHSSDSRSFSIRLRIAIPAFDTANPIHHAISALSRRAHLSWAESTAMAEIDAALDRAVESLSATPALP